MVYHVNKVLYVKKVIIILVFLILIWQVGAVPAYYYILKNGQTVVFEEMSCKLPVTFFHRENGNNTVTIGNVILNKNRPKIEVYTLSQSDSINSSTGPAHKYIGENYIRTPLAKEMGLDKSQYNYSDGSVSYIWWYKDIYVLGSTVILRNCLMSRIYTQET